MKSIQIIIIIFFIASASYAQQIISDTNIRVSSNDGIVSIVVPKNWDVVKDFKQHNVKLLILSSLESNNDIFMENIVIIDHVIRDNETIEEYIDSINAAQKELRPDFTITERSECTIDGLEAYRIVCRMTFPEFVSKNIQYIIAKDEKIYTITASIPEDEYEKWQEQMDCLCKTVKIE